MWLDDFRRRTAWNAYANERRYDAPADSWAFVYVDPQTTEYSSTVSLEWGLNRVCGGDWDLPTNCRTIASLDITQGLVQRFEEGREWPETAYYETAVDRIDEDGSFRGVDSVAELREGYLPAVDGLYETMSENGYRPNRGTVYSDPDDADYIHDLEPMIMFSRDGEPIWTEGYHRLVMARLFGFDAIPVYVLRRHVQWQQTRDRIVNDDAARSEIDACTDHPDVRGLSSLCSD